MSEMLSKLYQVQMGGELSSDDVQKINAELVTINVQSIPQDQRKNVEANLSKVLMHQSVESEHIPALDALLDKLRSVAE